MSESQPRVGPWPGRFVWHDLMTKDARKAQEFYCSLFDWQLQQTQADDHTYSMITCGPGPIGGIVEEQNIPVAHWMPYAAVEDVDSTAKKIADLGGSVHVPPTDIPNTGRFAVCRDPQGAFFSIYTGLPSSPGADPDTPVPGRVCWNEVYTTDVDAGQKFYSEVFGWKPEIKDMGEAGKYHAQVLGDKQAGGLMKVPQEGMPSCWAIYFLVTDLQTSTDKAKELGAAAMMESIPIPEIGSFSMLTDPTGAAFALFAAAPGLGQC